jgi:ubiquinone biosynthesis protein COQ9
MDEQALKDEILLAALPNIVFDGWNRKTLRTAAIDAGHGAEMAVHAFPNGVPDALEHFSDWADRQMLARCEAAGLSSMRVPERIRVCVRARLEVLEPYREAVSSGLGILATNGPLAARALYRTVNRMWYAAGDSSTDFNWYTKRGLLAGVVTSTTLYWLNDRSEGRAESWGFLDRRLGDVAQFGKATGGVKAVAGQVGNLASLPFKALLGLRSTLGRAGAPRSRG